ncbi:MAG: NDP-sugar synthase [Pyrinomonadaceae bacterium]|nr:NDP-sugar synthase [Pyrinomonadaceae bacterium]
MQALILAGGRGTDLRPLTVYTPKPVVPLVNRPLLYYQIELLKRVGVTDVTLSINYQPDKINTIFGDGSDLGMNIRYVTEANDFGSAGAYKNAGLDPERPTIVLKSGIVTNLILAKVIKKHTRTNAAATICTTNKPSEHTSPFVEIDSGSNVIAIHENAQSVPETSRPLSAMLAGVYILAPEVLSRVPDECRFSLEYDLLSTLLNEKSAVTAFDLDEFYWTYISTPSTYLKAHQDFLAGKVKNFEIERLKMMDIAVTTFIDEKSVIDKDCVIKPNVIILNSVIGEGVHIEAGVSIKDSVIWSHSRISDNSEIRGSILARSTYVGKDVSVSEGSVLGDKTSLPDHTRV